MRKILIILFLCFTNISFSNAANIGNIEIKIIGNENLDKEFIESIIDTNTNLEDEELVNYIIKELFSTGYFESVDAIIIDKTLNITLNENPSINKIKFVGNERFKSDDLNKLIQDNSEEINIYNKSNVEKLKKILVQYYKAFGFNLIKIDQSIEKVSENQVNLFFNINEGEITKIGKINIIGNKEFSSRKIKSMIRSSETKFYKIISGTSKYNENLIYLDEQMIEEFYKNKGFKNVKVKSSISEFIKDKNQIILNYFIDEGIKFKISNIEIKFDTNLNTENVSISENLIDELEIKKNKTYHANKIYKSSERIYNHFQNQGLVFIDVESIETEEEDFVKLVFLITKIEEKYVSEIDINGNIRTKDKVIRREIELNEGDPYIPYKINKSKKNITNLQFFEKIDINTNQVDDKVNIDVDIIEKPTGEFNIGATIDTFQGVAFLSSLKEKNIFGDGRYIALSFNTSNDNAGINLDVIEPYINNKKINLLYNLNFKNNDYLSSSGYKLSTQTIGIGSNYNLSEDISHSIKLDYTLDDYNSIRSTASDSIKKLGGKNVFFIISNRISKSSLDARFRPSEGQLLDWLNRLTIDNYILNKVSFDKYYNINKKIFSIRSEIGNISSFSSDDVPDGNKFSIGGRKLRGFDISGVGPRNSSTGYIGGNNLISTQIDYAIPLSESDNNILDFVTFLDAGTVFENKTKPTNSKESLRMSTGFGFNLNTPIGPLSLTYAIPIQSESYDKERKFVFSIGWVN